jgi:hypothetical protein
MSGTTTTTETTATTMNRLLEEAKPLSKLPNRVADMLAGRAILITGGTGFMGKVLIEKILRTCSDVDTIYLLIRAKKGKEPSQRVDEIFASPVSDFNEEKYKKRVMCIRLILAIFAFKTTGRISMSFGKGHKKRGNVRINLTLRRFRVTIVALENQ